MQREADRERQARDAEKRRRDQEESARRRAAEEDARRRLRTDEDALRRKSADEDRARQDALARSKAAAAKRESAASTAATDSRGASFRGGGQGGGLGFGGGGLGFAGGNAPAGNGPTSRPSQGFGAAAPGSGGGGDKFAWKKSTTQAASPEPQGLSFGRLGAKARSADPRFKDLPSHDECETGISAMISRTHNGMKEGLGTLGLPNFPLVFVAGQELKLCGHNVREAVNEMIHHWMTDEKDDFYDCLLRLKNLVSKPILSEEEMMMMDEQEDWDKKVGTDGKPVYMKRDGAPSATKPPARPDASTSRSSPSMASRLGVPQSRRHQEDSDSGDEVIDVVPGGRAAAAAPSRAASGASGGYPATGGSGIGGFGRGGMAAPAPAAPPADEDYYALLGVTPTSSLQEIRSKFRTLVITEHPEKGGDVKKFQKINKAYGVLSDQQKRREYDESIRR